MIKKITQPNFKCACCLQTSLLLLIIAFLACVLSCPQNERRRKKRKKCNVSIFVLYTLEEKISTQKTEILII